METAGRWRYAGNIKVGRFLTQETQFGRRIRESGVNGASSRGFIVPYNRLPHDPLGDRGSRELMDSSENKIQPVKAGSGSSAVPTAFAGTVTGVKTENGEQSVEIRFPQGRIKVQAEGEFQPGERVKLTFAGNGSVQLEKGPMPEAQGDGDGVGYKLPANLSTLKDLRAFEENVSRFLAGKETTGLAAGSQAGARTGGTEGNTSLPQLLMQAMGKQGGRDMLAEYLPALHRGVVSALIDALQETEGGDPGSKAGLLDLMKALGKSRIEAGAELAGGKAQTAAADTGKFMTGEVGAGHTPWFGRIASKSQAEGFLTPMQRLQFGGAGMLAGAPTPLSARSEPLFRYQMDMGGRTLEVFSAQDMEAGEFADFDLERQGGRVQARFSDPAASLPGEVRTAMAGSSPELRRGMLVASHYLQDFKGEPYYGRLIQDFGEVLAQSGAMEAKTADGRPGNPDRKDLDGLLKLFVAYPRDADHPERQAKVWGDALKDPQAMMRLLKVMQPEQDASLLRAATGLRLAPAQALTPGDTGRLAVFPPMPPMPPMPLMSPEAAGTGGGEGQEASAAWLRTMLPEAFSSGDLLKLAADGSPLTSAGKEHESALFLLQAVANGFPREDQIPEGKPSQFYFYQGQEWRNLQVTWKREGGGQGKGKAGPKAPLQVRVETTAKHMGKVNVAVSWEPKGAKLDFRNQFHDARELLRKFLPELEKSLALLDFKVTSWNYELLPPDESATPAPDPGWTRPASLSDGFNLDMLG